MKRSLLFLPVVLIVIFLFSSCTAYTYFPGGADEDFYIEETEAAADAVYADMGSVTYLENITELPTEHVTDTEEEAVPEEEPSDLTFNYTRELKRDCADGEDVRQLQQRLMDLVYLDADEATTHFGSETRNAVALFQELHGLTPDGIVGKETADLLFSPDAVPFEIAFDDVAPTVHMDFAELVGDNGLYDYPKGYPSPDTYKIIVDIENQVTMVYTKDENGEYTVPARYMICSTGVGDATPVGNFDMDSYRVRFSIFVRDGRYGQYWTQIRRAIYFHTMLYSAKDASTYLEDTFLEFGKKASHGCIRLCVPDARWMWYHIAPGTKCEIRNSGNSSVIAAAVRSKLKLAQPPEEHLDLRPGEIPNTDNWSIGDVPHDVPFTQGSQE